MSLAVRPFVGGWAVGVRPPRAAAIIQHAGNEIESDSDEGRHLDRGPNITDEQAEDLAGVLSRAALVPGVPDWVKLHLVKQGIGQVVGAINDGRLPPDLKKGILDAMGDGNVSDRLAGQLAHALNPYIDLPILNEEQEYEILKNIISYLIVQKEDDNLLLEAAKGSAKFATVQGSGMVLALAELRSTESRKALAHRVCSGMDIPLLPKEQVEQIVQGAVDALGGAVIDRVPPGALEAAITAGRDSEVEAFLTAMLADEINVPFINEQQRREMAQAVIVNWLGLVDKEALRQELAEAEQKRLEEEAQRSALLNQSKQVGESVGNASQVFLGRAGTMIQRLTSGNTRTTMASFVSVAKKSANSTQAWSWLQGIGNQGIRALLLRVNQTQPASASVASAASLATKSAINTQAWSWLQGMGKQGQEAASNLLALTLATGGGGGGGGGPGGSNGNLGSGGASDGGSGGPPGARTFWQGNDGFPRKGLVIWAIFCFLLAALLVYAMRRQRSQRIDAPRSYRSLQPTANIVPIGLAALAVVILLLCLSVCRLIAYVFHEPHQDVVATPSQSSAMVKLQPKTLVSVCVLGLLLIFLLCMLRRRCQQRRAKMPSRRDVQVVQTPTTPVQSHTQGLASAFSNLPNELHQELINWLSSVGLYKDIDKTAGLALLFAIYLLGTPEQAGRGSRSSLIICPYVYLSDIMAQCGASGRWRGKEVAVRRTEDWPFLRERCLGETSSTQPADFLLRPNGALHAVITPGHASRGGVSMQEVGAKHSSVVVLDVHFLHSRSGSGQLLVHHNGRTWRSPKLQLWASAEADALAAARQVVAGL